MQEERRDEATEEPPEVFDQKMRERRRRRREAIRFQAINNRPKVAHTSRAPPFIGRTLCIKGLRRWLPPPDPPAGVEEAPAGEASDEGCRVGEEEEEEEGCDDLGDCFGSRGELRWWCAWLELSVSSLPPATPAAAADDAAADAEEVAGLLLVSSVPLV